jgi:hypothetical protein
MIGGVDQRVAPGCSSHRGPAARFRVAGSEPVGIGRQGVEVRCRSRKPCPSRASSFRPRRATHLVPLGVAR